MVDYFYTLTGSVMEYKKDVLIMLKNKRMRLVDEIAKLMSYGSPKIIKETQVEDSVYEVVFSKRMVKSDYKIFEDLEHVEAMIDYFTQQ